MNIQTFNQQCMTLQQKKRIKLICCLIIAFINAICTQAITSHAVFGWNYLGRRTWLLYFLTGFIVSFLFFSVLDLFSQSIESGEEIKEIKWLPIVFILCWLPYLIIYYPGLVNYDTVNQVLDFFDKTAAVPFGFVAGQEEVTVLFNAHHPVFVTIIFGSFIMAGNLVGNPALGLALFILFQIVSAALIFSYVLNNSCTFFDILGKKLLLFFVLFFAICPIIPFYVCIMLKNSMHSLVLVMYVFLYLKITLRGHTLEKKEKIIWVITAFLLPLTQNTGIYFLVLTCIPLIIAGTGRNRKFLSVVLGIVVAFMLFLTRVLYPALNIFPGGKQEMLGTLFQQTGRYFRDYSEEVSDKDQEIISKVIDVNALVTEYDFDTTDPIKATFNLHASGEELGEYFKLSVQQEIKHPSSLFRAILPIFGRFFAFGYDIGIFDHIPSDEGIFARIQHVRPEEEYTIFSEWYYWLEKFPGIDILFQHALYTLWIPLYCIYRSLLKKKKMLMFIIPFFVNDLFLIVSPMGYSRYALPLIFTSPLLLFIMMGNRVGGSD